jgi:hypothetical protein
MTPLISLICCNSTETCGVFEGYKPLALENTRMSGGGREVKVGEGGTSKRKGNKI